MIGQEIYLRKIIYLIVNVIFVVVFIAVLYFCILGYMKVKCTVELDEKNENITTMQVFYSEHGNNFSSEKKYDVDNRGGKFEVDMGQVILNTNGLRFDFDGDFDTIIIKRISFSWYSGSVRYKGSTLDQHIEIIQCGENIEPGTYKATDTDFGLIFNSEFVTEVVEQASKGKLRPLTWVIYLYLAWGVFCLLKKRRKPRVSKKINYCLLFAEGIFLAAGFVGLYAIRYLISYFGNISWTDIVFHLNLSLEGSNLSPFAVPILLGCLIAIATIALVICLGRVLYMKEIPSHSWCCGMGVMLVLLAIGQLCVHFDWIKYYQYTHEETKLYDNYYGDARQLEVTFPEQKRNLIYIFLESMEITYADKASGGAMDENYIPELTGLSQENVNFSDGKLLNGGYPVSGAGFTLGALVAQTAGVPINQSLVNNDTLNSSWKQDNFFLSGVYSIGDLLDDAGYNQILLIGSDGSFAGRNAYFRNHRNYVVWDYYTALEENKIPEGYNVWWGYEDKKLISFAKDKIMELSKRDEPFNVTLLTADTHFTDGYVCEECEDDFDQQYSNVMACSSRQLSEFIEWIQEQPFYENTTIILSGDHLTMDSNYITVTEADNYDRRTYFTIINPADSLEDKATYRQFSTLDIYPTTVAALGAQIEGNRLGLGVNLFSEEPTLVEEMGLFELNVELLKNSKYYQKKLLYK